MNRREALAALVAMPEVARISSVPASANDVLVIECDDIISPENAERLLAELSVIWPDRKAVIFSKGMRLKLASK
jgi:hypothetical protein